MRRREGEREVVSLSRVTNCLGGWMGGLDGWMDGARFVFTRGEGGD